MVKRRFYCLSSLLAVLLGWFGSLPLSCSTTSSAGIDFSYDPSASNGPTHWGQLKDSSMCSQGKEQSPVGLKVSSYCNQYEDYQFEVGRNFVYHNRSMLGNIY